MARLQHVSSDEQLLSRIRAEYIEMPGLRLTREQGVRLWGLDAPTCARLLKDLVDARFLCCGADGRYGRTSEFSAAYSPVNLLSRRMAKADVDSGPRNRRHTQRLSPTR